MIRGLSVGLIGILLGTISVAFAVGSRNGGGSAESRMVQGSTAGLHVARQAGDKANVWHSKREFYRTYWKRPGFGMTMQVQLNGDLIVESVYPGLAASRGGLRLGDVIVALDGKSCIGWPGYDAIHAVRAGSHVFRVFRDRELLDLQLSPVPDLGESVIGLLNESHAWCNDPDGPCCNCGSASSVGCFNMASCCSAGGVCCNPSGTGRFCRTSNCNNCAEA